ncbi:hypothetical protein GO009_07010 [Muricauda sp. TY007]|uniref:hypothetical protein n=1 Tax=Allomuricauda sp. TY007 TaxID=2683200 RepID=UPI0013BEDF91|nr:hypothetical protein [Muricauda sp. TY007]NDV15773.1 hypothetical protein [Muricauda sp. TY007]
MKTLAIFCIGMVCLTVSCSPDHELNTEPLALRMEHSLADSTSTTDNNGLAGQLYLEFMEQHGTKNISHWSLADIDREVRSLFREHGHEVSVAANRPLYDTGPTSDESFETVLEGFTLSEPARASLLAFLKNLATYPPNDSNGRQDLVLSYGSEVAQQTSWTEEDRRVIMSAISIIGQTDLTLYAEDGNREDEDWDIGVGNKSPVVANALENTVTVVTLAVYYTSRYEPF